jgi:phosphatidylglycerophosphate synthase
MAEKDEDKKLSSERVQTSLLAASEKRVLVWLATRLPRWVTPDQLTFLGLVAMVGIGVAYYLSARHYGYLLAASLGLMVNWFGDSLDGTLARVRKMERPKYGYYLDHLVDAFGTSFMLLGLAYSGFMSPPLGIALLTLYLIMSINVYLATHTVGVFNISFARLSPTEGRILLIVLNISLIFVKEVRLFSWRVNILDAIAGITGSLLLVLSLRNAGRNLSALNRTERAAWDHRAESP